MHEEEANESGNSVEEVEATLIGFVYIFFQFFLFRSYRPEPVTKHAIFPFFSPIYVFFVLAIDMAWSNAAPVTLLSFVE